MKLVEIDEVPFVEFRNKISIERMVTAGTDAGHVLPVLYMQIGSLLVKSQVYHYHNLSCKIKFELTKATLGEVDRYKLTATIQELK